MSDRSGRCFDLLSIGISLCGIVVTMALTYVEGVWVHFRGSSLVYSAWVLLAVSILCGTYRLRGNRSRACAALRTITFVLGLVSLGFALYLNAYAVQMLDWWPVK
jgi:hypothetical protein